MRRYYVIENKITEEKEYKAVFKKVLIKEYLKLLWLWFLILESWYFLIKSERQLVTKIILGLGPVLLFLIVCNWIYAVSEAKSLRILIRQLIQNEWEDQKVFKIKNRIFDKCPRCNRHYYEIEGKVPLALEGVPHINFRGIKLFPKDDLASHSAVFIFDWDTINYYDLQDLRLFTYQQWAITDLEKKDYRNEEFLYFLPYDNGEHKDTFEIELLKDKWLNSPYSWRLELTDSFQRYTSELKEFRIEHESEKQVLEKGNYNCL